MFKYKFKVLNLHFDLRILALGAISCQSILGAQFSLLYMCSNQFAAVVHLYTGMTSLFQMIQYTSLDIAYDLKVVNKLQI